MHPALVHFPIAWVLLLVVMETAARLTGRHELSSAGFLLLALACLSFVPALITGSLRASVMDNDPEFQALMVPHRALNIGAATLCFTALAVRAGMRDRFGSRAPWSYLLLLACASALLLVAGYLGGKMVFG